MVLAVKEAGLSQVVYYSFFGIGFLVTYGFLVWYGKKINIKTGKMILAVTLGSIMVLCVMGLLQMVLTPLQKVIPIMNSYLNNMGRAFVFVPLVALAVSTILRIQWVKLCNVYAFSQTILWGFASLGCLFAGCCRGYPCDWGIYNAIKEIRLFPTQILNSVALLMIAGYLYTRCKGRAYKPDGKEYPIMLVLVGILRFSTEFLMDNPKIILGLSSLSFDSVIMCVVGAVWLLLLHRKDANTKNSAM